MFNILNHVVLFVWTDKILESIFCFWLKIKHQPSSVWSLLTTETCWNFGLFPTKLEVLCGGRITLYSEYPIVQPLIFDLSEPIMLRQITYHTKKTRFITQILFPYTKQLMFVASNVRIHFCFTHFFAFISYYVDHSIVSNSFFGHLSLLHFEFDWHQPIKWISTKNLSWPRLLQICFFFIKPQRHTTLRTCPEIFNILKLVKSPHTPKF